MLTVYTRGGRCIELTRQAELCDPVESGEYVRAYCHIHSSDHQRSLSIHRASGWGHCFNATCAATVLVVEWNPAAAQRLLQLHEHDNSTAFPVTSHCLSHEKRPPPRPRSQSPPSTSAGTHSTTRSRDWQQEERLLLHSLEKGMQQALACSSRAQAYLEERGVSLSLALAAGIGYLPSTLCPIPGGNKQHQRLCRWRDRLIFPLASPAGKGYIGRSLSGWQPGMDEDVHRALLEQPEAPRRWLKTRPAGWFGPDLTGLADFLILVEGAFDRLVLLAAGFQSTEVVALAGTALQIDWLPAWVRTVILALDADIAGQDAACRLANRLEQAGRNVIRCPPPHDGWGKDWCERWRRLGPQSVWPLFEACSSLLSPR
jgi:hypothetical protein